MKLLTYEIDTPLGPSRRTGALLGNKDIVDLNLAYKSYLEDEGQFRAYDFADCIVPPDMLKIIRGGEMSLHAVGQAVRYARQSKDSRDRGLVLSLSKVRFKAPILNPEKILSTGINFMAHLNEVGWKPPERPAGFSKLPSAIIGHDENIVYPKVTKSVDYEIELIAVIGRKAKNVMTNDAYDYIAGYAIFDDITARDIQAWEVSKANQFVSKNLDTFSPIGPWIVTRDEVKDPNHLQMELRVNGEVRQKSNTSDMIFKVHDLVEYYSAHMTLLPGDMITCGTPGGVGFFGKKDPRWMLKPGDVIEAEIEGLGLLRNTIVKG